MFSTRHSFRSGGMAAPPSSEPLVIVGRIYATWCVPCENMTSAWKGMEKALASNPRIKIISIESANKDTDVANINTTYLSDAKNKLVPAGYPTIFVIDIGKKNITYYHGPRTVDDFVIMANSAIDKALAKGGGGGGGGGGGRKRRTRHKRRSARRTRRRRKA